jgi:hypothetical protein
MISVILASDFGNLGVLSIAVPALAIALPLGLIGVLKRQRWLIVMASALSLAAAGFLEWVAQSMGSNYPHTASDAAELQFFAAMAAGMAALILMGLLLPRD